MQHCQCRSAHGRFQGPSHALVCPHLLAERPAPPRQLRVPQAEVTARSLQLQWVPGSDGASPIRYFTAQVRELPRGPWQTYSSSISHEATACAVERYAGPEAPPRTCSPALSPPAAPHRGGGTMSPRPHLGPGISVSRTHRSRPQASPPPTGCPPRGPRTGQDRTVIGTVSLKCGLLRGEESGDGSRGPAADVPRKDTPRLLPPGQQAHRSHSGPRWPVTLGGDRRVSP